MIFIYTQLTLSFIDNYKNDSNNIIYIATREGIKLCPLLQNLYKDSDIILIKVPSPATLANCI